MKRLWLFAVFMVVPAGCGGGGLEGDEYLEAIPSQEMLALSVQDTVTSALVSEEGAVVGDPSKFQAHARAVMDGLNALFAKTYEGINNLVDNVTPVEITKDGRTCKVWEAPSAKAHWRLVSCRSKGQGKASHFDFVLKGRPLDSKAEADFVAVFAGTGTKLPSHEGHRRGVGKVGFNFDNLKALTGDQVGGRLGVAYRAAGRARQLVLALDNCVGPNNPDPIKAVYRYFHVIGKGGRFAFTGYGDYVGVDGQGKLVIGEDGVKELGRAVMGFRTDGAARTVVMACGGTVEQVKGPKTCVRVAQCWDANAHITFQDVFGQGGDAITWEPTACADIPLKIEDQIPDDSEPLPGATDPDTGAPLADEPAPMPEFE